MHTLHVRETTGKDGVLNLRIPLGRPDTECEVVVVVQPKAAAATTPEEKGWPPGYFEQVAGSISDETFIRHPQGELPPPVELE